MASVYNMGIQNFQTSGYGWEKNENSFSSEEIHGVTLHLASSVSNICVSLHDQIDVIVI